MDNQVPEVLMHRINKLMAERFLSKKEVAERLGMEYLTFWRKLKGKRSIDAVLLMKLAKILGTTVSYLIGETDNPSHVIPDMSGVIVQTNDPSRKIVSEPSRLSFNNGEFSIDMPDTPANKKWFDAFIKRAMLKSPEKKRETVATA